MMDPWDNDPEAAMKDHKYQRRKELGLVDEAEESVVTHTPVDDAFTSLSELIRLRGAKAREEIDDGFDHLKAKLEADLMVINSKLHNPQPEDTEE